MQFRPPVGIMRPRWRMTQSHGTAEMPKLDEQITTLQERLKQLKLRQQRSDARRRAIEAQREKKAETRRQFVAGAVILGKVREGVLPESQFRGWLDEVLTRPDDRALFDLPPKVTRDA